jgi:hypothetical protein
MPGWVLLALLALILIGAGLFTEWRNPTPKSYQPPNPTSTPPADEAASSSAEQVAIPEETVAEHLPETVAEAEHAVQPKADSEPLSKPQPESKPALEKRLNFRFSFDQTLFLFALLVYLLTRLIGLNNYPIYFFTDEAVNTNLASDLVRDGFHDYEGQLLPTFFKNYDKYNLSTSVYLQVVPVILFGRSVDVTRGTAVFATLLAAASVALILKHVFEARAWWSGALLLSITPAWFLHSRTAFETALMAAFFAAFLYFYLRYRLGSLKMLYAAVLFGALAFYTYSPARVILPVTGLFFLVADLRYHWKNRGTVLFASGMLVVCALPLIRFQLTHPGANYDQLYIQASYWTQPGSLGEKLGQFIRQYLLGLNPLYWYFPGTQDLPRHLFDGYGHLLLPALPLLVVGVIILITRLRKPEYKLLLLTILAIPTGAALIEVGITRLLALVIPFVILEGLGLSWLIDWLGKRYQVSYRRSAFGAFVILAFVNFWMLGDALRNGPYWSQNYGLTGMQWGAQQVFAQIERFHEQDPGRHIVFSPTWANGTDVLARFFMKEDPPPVELSSIDRFMEDKIPGVDQMLFVLPFYEYDRATGSGKFDDFQVEKLLLYPDGEPGFYFTRLAYVPNIDQMLQVEQQQRLQPVETSLVVAGQPAIVRYSPLDVGSIEEAFDGDPRSLCRTKAANPAIIEIEFEQPRTISAISIVIGSAQTEVTALMETPSGEEVRYEGPLSGTEQFPEDTLIFPAPVETQKLHLEIHDLHQGEPGHVHFWEITLN